MFIDSHAHLNFAELLADINNVLKRAKEAGVEKIISIGTSLNDSKAAVDLAQKYDNLYATVGIHPNDDPKATVESVDWREFERLAKQPKVVAIGETGLDFSRKRMAEEKERQKKLFIKQMEIAQKLNLPLSIHIRDAQQDLMEIFSDTLILCSIRVRSLRGVFHCFSGNEGYLSFILDKLSKFYISFAGNVTFKNAGQLQELAKNVPLERLLIETDCPFLAPEPHRGTRNEPAYVKITLQVLAKIKNVTLEELEMATTRNAETLFNIL